MKLSCWLLLPCLMACQGGAKEHASSVATAGAAPASASAPPPHAPLAWFVGAWQGTYSAELRRIELAVGGVKAWKEDDGKQASGAGKLSFEAKADGSVTGSASGPLGEQLVNGHIEGERVALTLVSSEANGYHGVIVAEQAAEGIKGSLSASTGDSLSVRQASVVLARATK